MPPGVGHEDLAGLLKEKGVATVLCGGIGGGAEQALRDAGLSLCSGVTGSADEAVSAYLAGGPRLRHPGPTATTTTTMTTVTAKAAAGAAAVDAAPGRTTATWRPGRFRKSSR